MTQPAILGFRVVLEAPLREVSADDCWFHPRCTAVPAAGKSGMPAVVLTLQKHYGSTLVARVLWTKPNGLSPS